MPKRIQGGTLEEVLRPPMKSQGHRTAHQIHLMVYYLWLILLFCVGKSQHSVGKIITYHNKIYDMVKLEINKSEIS